MRQYYWKHKSLNAFCLTFLSPSPMILRVQKPKWEKALPEKFMIAITEQVSTSLKIKAEIKTTDTTEKKSIIALLDSSTTGEFIDRDYAKSQWFNLLKFTKPIPVYNVDGSANEAGSITEAVSLILRYKIHSEQTLFCVTSLGKQKLMLGHSWLHKHNLEIDWTKGKVKMSRCPLHCCSRCHDEIHLEKITQKADTKRKDACSIGPMPETSHDSKEDSITDAVNPEDEPISVEEGDQILASGLLPTLSMDICASSTISNVISGILHQEERQFPPPSTGLPSSECDHHEEQVPTVRATCKVRGDKTLKESKQSIKTKYNSKS